MISLTGTMEEFHTEAQEAIAERGVLLERRFRLIREDVSEPPTHLRFRVSKLRQNPSDYDCYVESDSGRRHAYFQVDGRDATSALVAALNVMDHHLELLCKLGYRAEVVLNEGTQDLWGPSLLNS